MLLTTLVDQAAIIFSVSVKVFMLHQIWKIRKLGSVDSLSIPSFIMGFISYLTLAWSGALHGYWPNILGQTPGAILGAVIAWQIITLDTLPRYGLRANSWGHFTANKRCRACLEVLSDLGLGSCMTAPTACGIGSCHGLVHVELDLYSGDSHLSTRCDRCGDIRRGLTVSSAGILPDDLLLLRAPGSPWRSVSRGEFLAARGTGDGTPSRLLAFAHEGGAEGVVVPVGGDEPKDRESLHEFLARVHLIN